MRVLSLLLLALYLVRGGAAPASDDLSDHIEYAGSDLEQDGAGYSAYSGATFHVPDSPLPSSHAPLSSIIDPVKLPSSLP
jgi:hypothetical protein